MAADIPEFEAWWKQTTCYEGKLDFESCWIAATELAVEKFTAHNKQRLQCPECGAIWIANKGSGYVKCGCGAWLS